MEDNTFDAKIKSLATPQSRRRLMAAGTGGVFAIVASVFFGTPEADAKGKGRKGKRRKGKNDNEKVTICHKPGTPAEKTMRVPAQAVPGHLGHGDYLGECEEPEPECPDECPDTCDENGACPDPEPECPAECPDTCDDEGKCPEEPEPDVCPGYCKEDADCVQPENPYIGKNKVSCVCKGYSVDDYGVETKGSCEAHEEPKPEICEPVTCKADTDCNVDADDCACEGYVPGNNDPYNPVEEVLGVCGGTVAE